MFGSFINWIKWVLSEKPMIKYTGFNCGCCGRWHNENFEIPVYKSEGKWTDTFGLCPKGKGCQK